MLQHIRNSSIEPVATPLLMKTVQAWQKLCDAVPAGRDHQEIFISLNASDPTHPIISKEHFRLAPQRTGRPGRQGHRQACTNAVVAAWFDPSSAALNEAV